MSMFYKVMAALLLTLPVGAYVAGAQVGSPDDSAQTRLVRSDQPSPRDDRAVPPATPRPSHVVHRDGGPAPQPATTDDDAEHHEHSDHGDGDHGDHDHGGWGSYTHDHGDGHDHEGGDEH